MQMTKKQLELQGQSSCDGHSSSYYNDFLDLSRESDELGFHYPAYCNSRTNSNLTVVLLLRVAV